MLESDYTAIISNPSAFLYGPQRSTYVWPRTPVRSDLCEFTFESMFFVASGHQIGYVQQLVIKRPSPDGHRKAIVGHFAVEIGHERRGIGRALVEFLKEELHRRYSIRSIEFVENSSNWSAYPAFFESIGAQAYEMPLSTRTGYRLMLTRS